MRICVDILFVDVIALQFLPVPMLLQPIDFIGKHIVAFTIVFLVVRLIELTTKSMERATKSLDEAYYDYAKSTDKTHFDYLKSYHSSMAAALRRKRDRRWGAGCACA